MNPKALLFDLDQTLLASSKHRLKLDFILSALKYLRKRGFKLVEAVRFLNEMEKTMHLGDERTTNADRITALLKAARPHLTSDEASQFMSEWIHEVFSGLMRHFTPMLESEALIMRLLKEKRFRLILATNPAWPKSVVEMRMKQGNLKPEYFEWITHAHEMHFVKPDPRYYSEILAKLNLKATDCLMIGDSFKKDAPASEVGIPVFILKKDFKNVSALVTQGTVNDLSQKIFKESPL